MSPTSRPRSRDFPRLARARGWRLQDCHERSASAAELPVVTIDGPSGSGKGTVSRLLAQRSGWHLLDSGALYRLVALPARWRGLAAR